MNSKRGGSRQSNFDFQEMALRINELEDKIQKQNKDITDEVNTLIGELNNLKIENPVVRTQVSSLEQKLQYIAQKFNINIEIDMDEQAPLNQYGSYFNK